MPKQPPSIYADTSVFGGAFEPEFATGSNAFFELVRMGTYVLVVSAVVEGELERAPEKVRTLFDSLSEITVTANATDEVMLLFRSYMEHGIVPPSSETDALHVALATCSGCTSLVSWNCVHLVNMARIRKFNAVNQLFGYNSIAIHTPAEVIDYEI